MATEKLPRFDLPEVNFLTVDTATVEAGIIAGYERAAKRTLAQGDPIRLFLLSVAAEICGLRAEVNIAAQNNLLSYASGDYLDSLGAYFGVTRLAAVPAKGTFRFTLSTALADDVRIPAGTEVTNGTVSFATDEDAVILAGTLAVAVDATCTEPGTAGNGYTAGQIGTMVEPIAYVAEAVNVTSTTDGADVETDEAMAKRVQLAPNSFSSAGPRRAYVYHAYSASPAIIDVSVDSPDPGIVNVYLLTTSGQLPSQALCSDVLDVLNGEDVRPLTDEVHVYPPEAVVFAVVLDYWISVSDQSRVAEIQQAVTTAVEQYRQWQCLHIGRDIVPDKLVQLVIDAGAFRVDQSTLSPDYEPVSATQVAVCSGIVLTYKGLTNE